jgi:RNA-splicing ligase RtcB
MSVNKEVQEVFMNTQFKKDVLEVCELIGEGKNYQRHLLSVGSLGGGNHYIELNIDKNGEKWIVIHSGSRNFGNKIATYSQKLAIKYCEEQSGLYKKSIKEKISELKRENRNSEVEELINSDINIHNIPKELSFLEGELLNKDNFNLA